MFSMVSKFLTYIIFSFIMSFLFIIAAAFSFADSIYKFATTVKAAKTKI